MIGVQFMSKRKIRRRRKTTKRFLWIIVGIIVIVTFGMAAYMLIFAKLKNNLMKQESNLIQPDELLVTYMSYIQEKI